MFQDRSMLVNGVLVNFEHRFKAPCKKGQHYSSVLHIRKNVFNLRSDLSLMN